MSLALLAPLGLAALAALLLPLLVHLARREEQVPTDFAALRWLAAKFRPRQRLRFEEILLLVVRLLLVAALALLLAQPVLFGGRGDAPWLVVLPGADLADAPALPADAQRRWLAPGFPPLESPLPAGPVATASLLRQLDAELPAGTPLSVLVTATFDGADGARPQLSRRVDWRIAGGAPANARPATPAPFVLSVRHAPDDEAALPYLRAAMAAWHAGDEAALAASLDIASMESALPPIDRPLVWLAPGALPAPIRDWITRGGNALIAATTAWPLDEAGDAGDASLAANPPTASAQDTGSSPLARSAPLGSGRVLQFTQPLVPAAMPALLQPDFPARLRALLQPVPAHPTRADATAYAPITGGPSFPETPRDVSHWLAWLAAALFALERWLATGRREIAA